MAVSSSLTSEIKATPEQVMAAIAAVDRLPEWSSAHKSVTIESTHPDGRPHRVRMTVSIIGITDEQVVDYAWNGNESMSWTLVESSQQKQQDGAYALSPTADGTSVEFSLTIDPKIPLPGFLVKKAQKMAVETASKGLAAFVAKTV
ncbi:SRPBCC family protein [Rhodococcus sp. NPDC003382]|uniref:SRPBCC family protein n=1 Tax=unclassified Rhodococcus (in: high G+C Gram-positive bacteria) TaxID=192944 RepID=UPI0018CDD55C|nr:MULTISPECIES: SRPBCC family protein [unclassified Rhodococcus (in: high G+C Gram-positive bacteria)]MBH0118643.1 SRPBCC family protein [Rhodococcus sp. CX]MCK8675033.1 SRPBCC family protein [Rhodococcus sp. HM1]